MTYKYYPPTEFSFCALMSEYFWCSKRKFLNDPFDTHGEIINRFPVFKAELKRNGLKIDTYPTILDSFGVCCFSEELLNKHLWAFYADSYKGWCLEFDDEEFENNLSKQEMSKVIYSDVVYLEEWPNFDDFKIKLNYNKSNFTIEEAFKDVKALDKLFEYILLVKESGIWKNEREKRIILGKNYTVLNENDSSAGYKLSWPKDILKRIIVGHNIAPSHLETIKQIAKCKQIPLFKTKTVDSGLGFEMEIEKINLD